MTRLEMCRAAITAFWVAFYKAMAYPYDTKRVNRCLRDAEELAQGGDEGFRYGGPGWPHLKLHYDHHRDFWLESNGMELSDFLLFQEAVASEFEKNGLPFHHMTE